MARPTASCAKCVRELKSGCDHLANTYDRYALKTRHHPPEDLASTEIAEMEQELVEYALNRMLALDRDNGNKAEGLPASRLYKSRNETGLRALANLCGHQGPRGMRCIRQPHPQDPERHRF